MNHALSHITRCLMATTVYLSACEVAWSQSTTQGAEVTFRRGVPTVEGSVVSINQDGVQIASSTSADKVSILVPLDQISRVNGVMSEEWKVQQTTAESLWRARVRLERGDIAGAEPFFEELGPAYKDRTGPTAELAHGGLLLCRLARGAHVLAVEPFIDYCAALEGANSQPRILLGLSGRVEGSSELQVDPSLFTPVDPTYGLCPSLPPIFVSLSSVRIQSDRLTVMRTGRASHMAMLYKAAMKGEFESVAASLGDEPPSTDAGVMLVWELVTARHGTDGARQLARTLLSKRLATPQPAWVHAWCHAGLGRSLVKEPDSDSQMIGVAELAFLPSAYERTVPYLTGIALAESSLAMLRSGNDTAAVSLRERIVERFPSHPILEWDPIRHWNTTNAVELLRSMSSEPSSAPPSSIPDSQAPVDSTPLNPR